MRLIRVCHRCVPVTGEKPLCIIDGKPLSEHAAAGICPLGKFSPDAIERGRLNPPPKPDPPCIGLGDRPGSLVKSVLEKLGYTTQPGCGCEAKCREMNEWGWRGCWKRRAELVDWFSEKAAEIGIVVNKRTIRGLVIAGLKDQVRQLFAFWRRNTPADGMGQTAVESRSTVN